MPNNKSKGSKMERELFMKFIEHANGYRVVRVAGSGTMENADCDLIAGKKGKRKYGIEVKSSKKPVKYISKDQINRFLIFCEIFGLMPVIALRFNREGWLFVKPNALRDTGSNWGITLEEAREKGQRFAQFFGERKKNISEKKDSNEADYEIYLGELADEHNKV